MSSITETVRSTTQGMAKADAAESKAADSVSAVTEERNIPAEATESNAAEVQLSSEVADTIEAAEFDAAKVEALRLAIMDGNYPLDARRIAENMVSLERLIG